MPLGLGVPLVTQSDPGPENFGVANAQTVIRHRLDPTLRDTLQHRHYEGAAGRKSTGCRLISLFQPKVGCCAGCLESTCAVEYLAT
jgi:hypothetical protein